MLKKEDFAVVEELRGVLSKIVGVTSFTEVVSLSYVLQVKTEEDKAGVEKVANVLTEQASKYGLDLEITAATEAEVEEAKRAYQDLMDKKNNVTSFDFELKN